MHNPELLDYIGVESSIDFNSDVDFDEQPFTVRSDRRRRKTKSSTAEKEYPPPISWLARTGNLPSHMPWIMKRYYTTDGRLIIQEEKVKRHEYFQAHRSNGRLVLNLVPLDDAVEESFKEHQTEEKIGGAEEVSDDPTVEEIFVESYRYNGGGGVGVSPCGGLGVAVSVFPPPLHT